MNVATIIVALVLLEINDFGNGQQTGRDFTTVLYATGSNLV
jgi:hypothetical protein